MSVIVGDCICPICHSDNVRGFKVSSTGEWGTWWSQCVSGLDHGQYVTPDGQEHEWPKNPWFCQDGRIETPHGYATIERQENCPYEH